MEWKTGVMPSLEAAASERGSTLGRKTVGIPKGKAVWAKVIQMSGFDEEILGTESVRIQKQKSVPSCAIRALAWCFHIA
jgi:hypothetical protein